jgi:hypothetical protein
MVWSVTVVAVDGGQKMSRNEPQEDYILLFDDDVPGFKLSLEQMTGSSVVFSDDYAYHNLKMTRKDWRELGRPEKIQVFFRGIDEAA